MKKYILFIVLAQLPMSAIGATDYLLKLGGVDGETVTTTGTTGVLAPTPMAITTLPHPPTITAYGAVGKSFILDGSKSQDDDIIKTFTWRQVSGPVIKMSSMPAITITVVPPSAGTYVFDFWAGEEPGLDVVARRVTLIVENPLHEEKNTVGTNPLYEGTSKVAPPPATPPVKTSGEDPDFDLLKVAPPPPLPPGDPDFDLLNVFDQDDDGDMLPTADERLSSSVSVSKVTVQGWDPKKKEEFMSERKEVAEVRSGQDLEHFAQGILLEDEKIEDVQFNPKELSVSYEAEGKLLWFIPVSFTEQVVASGTEGDDSTVTFLVKKPWWSFLVSGDGDGDDTAQEVKDKHKETMQIESWSFGASNQASILKTISDVLKAKHDTAKNSVGNIR